MAEVMGACAEIGFLGHTAARVDFHRAKAIGMAAISQAGFVVKREIPGVIDAGALMHEGFAVDRGAEAAQHAQTPGIEGLGGPVARQCPYVLPEQKAKAVGEAPGAAIASGLGMGVTCCCHACQSRSCIISWKHAKKASAITLGW